MFYSLIVWALASVYHTPLYILPCCTVPSASHSLIPLACCGYSVQWSGAHEESRTVLITTGTLSRSMVSVRTTRLQGEYDKVLRWTTNHFAVCICSHVVLNLHKNECLVSLHDYWLLLAQTIFKTQANFYRVSVTLNQNILSGKKHVESIKHETSLSAQIAACDFDKIGKFRGQFCLFSISVELFDSNRLFSDFSLFT